jgi:hypothetical protein
MLSGSPSFGDRKKPEAKSACNLLKYYEVLVAGGGIEPPTLGL